MTCAVECRSAYSFSSPWSALRSVFAIAAPPNKNRLRPFLGREAISRFHPASLAFRPARFITAIRGLPQSLGGGLSYLSPPAHTVAGSLVAHQKELCPRLRENKSLAGRGNCGTG